MKQNKLTSFTNILSKSSYHGFSQIASSKSAIYKMKKKERQKVIEIKSSNISLNSSIKKPKRKKVLPFDH